MELYELTVAEASKGLQEKKFSSSELTGACLERIRAVEPKLRAFVTLTEAQALEQARKADLLLGSGEVRPLLGIPISIKDNFCTSGLLTTLGADRSLAYNGRLSWNDRVPSMRNLLKIVSSRSARVSWKGRHCFRSRKGCEFRRSR